MKLLNSKKFIESQYITRSDSNRAERLVKESEADKC